MSTWVRDCLKKQAEIMKLTSELLTKEKKTKNNIITLENSSKNKGA